MLFIEYPKWITPEIIPGLPFRWYGLMYLFGFATCYAFVITQLKKEKSAIVPYISNLFFWVIIFLLIGARVISEIVYSKNPTMLLTPWKWFWPFDDNGNFIGIKGMSYHGGLLGVIITVIIYCRIKRIAVAPLGDKIAIGGALGYTFGRLGNFINGELYGRITSIPWGIIFTHAERLPYSDPRVKAIADSVGIEPNALGLVNVPRHPSQLYEALTEGILTFLVLYLIYKIIIRTRYYLPGMIVCGYVICYGIARFVVEYYRQPDTGLDFVLQFSKESNPNWLLVSPWNFTIGQILSMLMILGGVCTLGLIYLYYHYKNKRKYKV